MHLGRRVVHGIHAFLAIAVLLAAGPAGSRAAAGAAEAAERRLEQLMDQANASLRTTAADVRVLKVDWISGDAAYPGRTIYSREVGNQFLDSQFVRGDQRRSGWSYPAANPDALVYSIEVGPGGAPFGMPLEEATGAIDRAMRTWAGQKCTTLQLTRETGVTADMDLGYLLWLVSGGEAGSGWLAGDIQHTGFDGLFVPGPIIAFTTTFYFVDRATGQLTDIDRDGRPDTAFREIYYSPGAPWTTRADADHTVADVETLALHEGGHGLSQGHFGTMFVRADGSAVNTPPAVMNAIYLGPARRLLGTDVGGHCGIWGSW